MLSWESTHDAGQAENLETEPVAESRKTDERLFADAYNQKPDGQSTGEKSLQFAEAFGAAALNSAVLHPVDGASELVSAGVKKTTGQEIPDIKLGVNPDKQNYGTAEQLATVAGTAAGYLAPLLATGAVTGALAKAAGATKAAEKATVAGETAAAGETKTLATRTASIAQKFLDYPHKSTIDGAITGLVLTPGAEENGEIDWERRAKTAAINGAAFGTMTATARRVHDVSKSVAGSGVDKRGILGATETVGEHTASGATGGIAAEQTKSLIEGNGLASPGELYTAAQQMIVRDASSASVNKAGSNIVKTIR